MSRMDEIKLKLSKHDGDPYFAKYVTIMECLYEALALIGPSKQSIGKTIQRERELMVRSRAILAQIDDDVKDLVDTSKSIHEVYRQPGCIYQYCPYPDSLRNNCNPTGQKRWLDSA